MRQLLQCGAQRGDQAAAERDESIQAVDEGLAHASLLQCACGRDGDGWGCAAERQRGLYERDEQASAVAAQLLQCAASAVAELLRREWSQCWL